MGEGEGEGGAWGGGEGLGGGGELLRLLCSLAWLSGSASSGWVGSVNLNTLNSSLFHVGSPTAQLIERPLRGFAASGLLT